MTAIAEEVAEGDEAGDPECCKTRIQEEKQNAQSGLRGPPHSEIDF
jgi:hypothetical protein